MNVVQLILTWLGYAVVAAFVVIILALNLRMLVFGHRMTKTMIFRWLRRLSWLFIIADGLLIAGELLRHV